MWYSCIDRGDFLRGWEVLGTAYDEIDVIFDAKAP